YRARTVEAGRKLLSPANLTAIDQLHRRAREGLAAMGSSLDRRGHLMADALQAVKEARQRGDTSEELDATDLWCQLVVLLWRRELDRLKAPARRPPDPSGLTGGVIENPVAAALEGLEKTLEPFAGITYREVRTAASDMAQRRPEDSIALATAADAIAVSARAEG